MHAVWQTLNSLLGLDLDTQDIDSLQMGLRTVVVYGWTLFLVRMGSIRFLGRASALDTVVAIMLGSIMSRGINGSGPLIPTLISGVVLMALHWVLVFLAERTGLLGKILKGRQKLIVEAGEISQSATFHTNLSRRDIEEALRLQLHESDITKVDRAYLERNGRISFIPARKEAQVLSVDVKDGVQRVHIKLD